MQPNNTPLTPVTQITELGKIKVYQQEKEK